MEAVVKDSAKKATDAREHLRLKKKEEDELRAKAKALATPACYRDGDCVFICGDRRPTLKL